MIEFSLYRWKCPLCGKNKRIKKCYHDGEYIKRCKCGGWARLRIEIRTSKRYYPVIIAAEET